MRRVIHGSAPVALLGPLALLGVLVVPGSAPVSDPGTRATGMTAGLGRSVDPTALRLLARAEAAPARLAYRGTQFVSAWTPEGSTGTLVHVAHRPGAGTTVTTPATGTAPAGHSWVPDGQVTPPLLGGVSTLTLLGEHYDVAVSAAAALVAGRSAQVVVASRPGAAHAAARFWLDQATGLVLRREVYDERGRVIRASAFVDLELGTAAAVTEVGDGTDTAGARAVGADAARAWPQTLRRSALDRMRGHGWACPDRLASSLQLVDARRGGGDYGGIVHLSYSDGLASVSVFEQHGRLPSGSLAGYRRTTVDGRPVYVRDQVPRKVVWSAHGTVYTVLADATPRTVDAVVTALPHDEDGGAWGRLGRGLDRVASWFNPLG